MNNRSVVHMKIEDKVNICREVEQKSIQDLAFEFSSESFKCSRPTLSKVLSKANIPSAELVERMEVYVKSVEEKFPDVYQPKSHSFLKSNEFVVSKDASNVIGLCAACQENAGMGVIVGRSGYGKTHALKHFAQTPNVIYVECNIATGHKELLTELATANRLTGKRYYKNIGYQIQELAEFYMANPGSLIIIDEADKLINKYGQTKIELVRAIFDQTSVGVVLAGEPNLRAMLENFSDRTANRVDFFYKLEGLGKDEVKKMLEKYDLDDEAMNELVARACNNKTGCFRLLDRTLRNIDRLMKKRDSEARITQEIIREASSLMML